MNRSVRFDQSGLITVNRTAKHAEDLSCRYFGLKNTFTKHQAYEYRTLSDLKDHEIIDHGFAHLVKYRLKPHKISSNPLFHDLYSICFQDHCILDVVMNRQDGIQLKPLMLYVMTHELVHIIRFSKFNQDFDVLSSMREKEEKKVHTITYEILRQLGDPGIDCVLDHYSPFRNPSIQ